MEKTVCVIGKDTNTVVNVISFEVGSKIVISGCYFVDAPEVGACEIGMIYNQDTGEFTHSLEV